MADQVEINQSKIRIAGIGGLGMVAMVPVMAYAMPEVRQFLFLTYGAGIAGAFAFIAYRRWIRPERPHRPTLMVLHTPERTDDARHRSGPEAPAQLAVVG